MMKNPYPVTENVGLASNKPDSNLVTEPQVVRELNNGDQAVSALIEAVNRLENRLDAVLNSYGVGEAENNVPKQDFVVLAGRINAINSNVFGVAHRINGLIDRLEI